MDGCLIGGSVNIYGKLWCFRSAQGALPLLRAEVNYLNDISIRVMAVQATAVSSASYLQIRSYLDKRMPFFSCVLRISLTLSHPLFSSAEFS